jgi:glycosyltransferase involved in cell wall biosynthesis
VRVLAFGTYQRDYPRNAQVRSCLRHAGVTVAERHVGVWDGRREAWSAGVGAAARLAIAEARLAIRRPIEADVLLVGYPGQLDLAAAKLAARGRPIVFDPLVSLWDTLARDRGRFGSRSVAGHALRSLDRWALGAADLVIADTAANARFYAEELGAAPERLRTCFVGTDDRLFTPAARDPGPRPFHALFVGKLIPLHGVETIIAAARQSPAIPFRIVGSGQLEALLRGAPPNVEHVPWIEYRDLPIATRRAGCALGVFGTSDKAARVIPNKAFQALACAVPLVTADTPAARELLTNGVDALLVPPGDPAALAGAVESLAADSGLSQRIGDAGRQTYEAQASEPVLGRRWRALLEELVGG